MENTCAVNNSFTLKKSATDYIDRVTAVMNDSTFKTCKEIANEAGLSFNHTWPVLRWLEYTYAVRFRVRKTGGVRSMEYSLREKAK